MAARHLALCAARHDVTVVAEAATESCFTFLSEARSLGSPIDWTGGGRPAPSPLWLFHLHYHEFLLDLLGAHREAPAGGYDARIWTIVSEWIRGNRIASRGTPSPAWHPYCISRRIPVWLVVSRELDPPEAARGDFFDSLSKQLGHLERSLERDLGGNHLLENLRALAIAGAVLGGRDGDRWLDVAARHIPRELEAQVLESGEHFERSPMYHARGLATVLDIRDATRRLRPRVAKEAERVAKAMAGFLAHILHPDGRIPLLGDSTFSETPSPLLLMDAAGAISGPEGSSDADAEDERASLRGASWVWRDGSDYLIYDAGPVGADELPAHAHCDLLGVEATIGDRRFLVDSGVHDYLDSPMRAHCRSTGAHNVLRLDGVEQCDVWSRFRMGYRGRPTSLDYGAARQFRWCRATHDAYRRVGVPVVGRWVACRPGGPWIFTEWAEGRAREVELSLHLHPDVTVSEQSGHLVRLSLGPHRPTLRFCTPGSVTLGNGWYCPDFGVRIPCVVCDFTVERLAAPVIVWAVSWGDDEGDISVSVDDRGVAIDWTDPSGRDLLNAVPGARW